MKVNFCKGINTGSEKCYIQVKIFTKGIGNLIKRKVMVRNMNWINSREKYYGNWKDNL